MRKNYLVVVFLGLIVLFSWIYLLIGNKTDFSSNSENKQWSNLVKYDKRIENKIDDKKAKSKEREIKEDTLSRLMESLKDKKVPANYLEKAVVLDSWENVLIDFYNKLESSLKDNISRQKKIGDLILNIWDVWKGRKIKVKVKDINWKPIEWVKIYLWWYLLGSTDKDGRLILERKVPRYLDYLYFQAIKEWYSPGFKVVNAMYHEGKIINVKFILKKWEEFVVDNSNNINLNSSKVLLSIRWSCVLKDSKNSCYNWQATVVISYVDPKERDLLSIPTKAIWKDKIVYLMSNWMAFITFYDNDGKLLKINENGLEKVNICYKVGQDAIEKRNKMKRVQDSKESDWYWWFNWNKWVWEFDKNAIIKVDEGKWLFCFSTKKIY